MFDLLIRGGEVVAPQGVGKWSIGINGDQIAKKGDRGIKHTSSLLFRCSGGL